MEIVSLYSGCGGLDLGFTRAGFQLVWANEYDREIWETFEKNHPETPLDRRNILQISSREIPECTGIVGGPPCQSWSEAGSRRGISDQRGQLFYEYIRVLQDKHPLFFLAENVAGMLAPRHRKAYQQIIRLFEDAGYNVAVGTLNAMHYGVPQDRLRVFFVGYHKHLNKSFRFPAKQHNIPILRDCIWDLKDTAIQALEGNKTNGEMCLVSNHEYFTGGFSPFYLSRNRVRGWDTQAFTIQASGRHAPLHPQASPMILVGKDNRIFDPNTPAPYRRLSVRECARIQTFPDDFIFYYSKLNSGYKMIGNAVPVNLANRLACAIRADLFPSDNSGESRCDPSTVLRQPQLALF